jgi:hypothetical protein
VPGKARQDARDNGLDAARWWLPKRTAEKLAMSRWVSWTDSQGKLTAATWGAAERPSRPISVVHGERDMVLMEMSTDVGLTRLILQKQEDCCLTTCLIERYINIHKPVPTVSVSTFVGGSFEYYLGETRSFRSEICLNGTRHRNLAE